MTEVIAKREALHYERHVDRRMQITYQKIGNSNKSEGSYPVHSAAAAFRGRKRAAGTTSVFTFKSSMMLHRATARSLLSFAIKRKTRAGRRRANI